MYIMFQRVHLWRTGEPKGIVLYGSPSSSPSDSAHVCAYYITPPVCHCSKGVFEIKKSIGICDAGRRQAMRTACPDAHGHTFAATICMHAASAGGSFFVHVSASGIRCEQEQRSRRHNACTRM